MRRRCRVRTRFIAISLAIALALAGAPGAVAVRGTGAPAASVVVHSGDAAPVSVAIGSLFESVATTPGAIQFIDRSGSALFEKRGQDLRVLAYAGEAVQQGVTIASLREVAGGADGSLAFLGLLPDRREGIFRIAPARGAPELVLLAGSSLDLRDGPGTVGVLEPPLVDPTGSIVASIHFLEGPAAIVGFPPAGAPHLLLQTGDPLGTGELSSLLAAPAMSPSGRMAFVAALLTGEETVGLLDAGVPPLVLLMLQPPAGPLSPSLAPIPPAINDAGQVAFLLVDHGTVRVQRLGGGAGLFIAGTGSAAPGGGTFTKITARAPWIDSAGRAGFGALRSNGRSGFYLSDGFVRVIVEEGMAAGASGVFTDVETDPEAGAAAAMGSDGVVHVAATAGGAAGIFSIGPAGVALEAGSDEPIPEPRFVSFLDTRVPTGGGGPFLAPNGRMLFDARVTGGRRGLFARDPSGSLRTVALDGDPAPVGGRFVGDRFAYGSINDTGTVAFLGEADDPGRPAALSLFYGSVEAGGLARVVDTELLPAGAARPPGSPGGGDRVLGAPSRVNRTGRVAVPVAQNDGTSVLMVFDGSELFRAAGPGDPAPGGGTFTTAFTGSQFTGVPVPPVLEDGERLLFGALTSSGEAVLYATTPTPASGTPPVRLLGSGDPVDGGRLSPFELQALASGADGRLLFQSIYSDEFDFADFVTGPAAPARLAARFDPVPDGGFVLSVLPLLASLGGGRAGLAVATFDGSEIVLSVDPDGGSDPEVLAQTSMPAPDGGVYLTFRAGLRDPGRLGADGRGGIALAAATTAGPEEIVLFGPANAPPIADAGPDLTVECAAPGGTEVTLDGGASADPDGDSLSYRWSGPFGEAEGPRPAVRLPPGVSTISLIVDDGQAASEPDTLRVTVRDTLPPGIEIAATPAVLWPPDGRLAPVAIALRVADRCDANPSVQLLEVASSEPGAGRPGVWLSGAETGADDRALSLRADRAGNGPGRVYTLTYRATDASGNAALARANIAVPHDLGH